MALLNDLHSTQFENPWCTVTVSYSLALTSCHTNLQFKDLQGTWDWGSRCSRAMELTICEALALSTDEAKVGLPIFAESLLYIETK